MLSENELATLHTNQRLLAQELIRRGVFVEIFEASDEILIAHFAGRTEIIIDRDSSAIPYAVSVFCSDKHHTKRLLERHDIGVPRGSCFSGTQIREAVDYAIQLGFPLVVKPATGSHGENVVIGIKSPQELVDCLNKSFASPNGSGRFLVEEYCPGNEYRLFLTRDGHYAALLREPAEVVGDGKSDIRTLIAAENDRRTNPRRNCLCPLRQDETAQAVLREQNYVFDSIPKAGMRVRLANNSNVATGGMCTDVTDEIHPTVLDIAGTALAAFPGLPYAGFDFITADISRPQDKRSLKLLEVNSNPGLNMHHAPGKGLGRNVAAMVANFIFPEAK